MKIRPPGQYGSRKPRILPTMQSRKRIIFASILSLVLGSLMAVTSPANAGTGTLKTEHVTWKVPTRIKLAKVGCTNIGFGFIWSSNASLSSEGYIAIEDRSGEYVGYILVAKGRAKAGKSRLRVCSKKWENSDGLIMYPVSTGTYNLVTESVDNEFGTQDYARSTILFY